MENKSLFCLGLVLCVIVFFSFSTKLPERQNFFFFSDGSSYFSIIQSLAYDFDLEYTRQDIIRIKEQFPRGPVGLFLKKGKDGKIYYAKSFVYPLIAAPFYRVFGVHGILLCNGLMLFFVILMGFFLLKQFHPQALSLKFILIFVLGSVTPVYIWWMQADLFNFFTLFAGLFFFFYPFHNRYWIYLSPVFFCLAAFRPPNIIPVGILFLGLLLEKKWKLFLRLAVFGLIFLSLLVLFNFWQTGEINYMGGERRSFHQNFPYEKPEYSFSEKINEPRMTADNYFERYFNSPHMFALNSLYYFFGRFTGMFIYFFPAFFIFILFYFQAKDRQDWFIFWGIIASILFYLLITPDNYFGGSGSVGNRYFLNIFPFFFFLGYKQRLMKYLAVPMIAAALFLSGIFADSHFHSNFARKAGVSFPINCFPAEKTQYQCLPSNENPRSFGKVIKTDEGDCLKLFILNDNYWPVDDNTIWTRKNYSLELFLEAEKPFHTLVLSLISKADQNIVSLQVEQQKRKMCLRKNQFNQIELKNLNGLRVNNKYVYSLKIKANRFYIPYFEESDNEDQRQLGVNIHFNMVQ